MLLHLPFAELPPLIKNPVERVLRSAVPPVLLPWVMMLWLLVGLSFGLAIIFQANFKPWRCQLKDVCYLLL